MQPRVRHIAPRAGSAAAILMALCVPGCSGLWSYGRLETKSDLLFTEARNEFSEAHSRRIAEAIEKDYEEEKLERDELIRRELASEHPALGELRLDDALAVAVKFSREYEAERDRNVTTAIALIESRHGFTPRLSGSVSATADATLTGNPGSFTRGDDYAAALGVDLDTTWGTSFGIDVADSTDASVTISHPLLAGSGVLVNRESLTQAERDLMYRLRAFELFRQSFTINTVRQYYDLVRLRQVIVNTRRSYKQSDFLYRRAQALFNAGRIPEIDVFQAEQQRLQAENNLRDAEESYTDALLAFKTFLGVPIDIELDIAEDDRAELRSVKLERDRAIALALSCRLDLATDRDRLEDSRRQLRISRRGLLPGLTLDLSTSAPVSSTKDLFDAGEHSSSASLSLTLPLDRLNDVASVRRARLSLDAQERAYSLSREQVASEVRRLLRRLRRIEQSMAVQKRLITTADKRLSVAEVRFRQGSLPSRDVVEAQQEILEARNTWARYEADYTIAELEFLKAIGVLLVDATGKVVRDPRLEAILRGEADDKVDPEVMDSGDGNAAPRGDAE